jgi:hypothetical protein
MRTGLHERNGEADGGKLKGKTYCESAGRNFKYGARHVFLPKGEARLTFSREHIDLPDYF